MNTILIVVFVLIVLLAVHGIFFPGKVIGELAGPAKTSFYFFHVMFFLLIFLLAIYIFFKNDILLVDALIFVLLVSELIRGVYFGLIKRNIWVYHYESFNVLYSKKTWWFWNNFSPNIVFQGNEAIKEGLYKIIGAVVIFLIYLYVRIL